MERVDVASTTPSDAGRCRPVAEKGDNQSSGRERAATSVDAELTRAEVQWLKDRLARYERGMLSLRGLLREAEAQREAAERERDESLRPLWAAIKTRDERIESLQAEREALRSEVGARGARISALRDEVEARQTEVEARQAEVEALEAEIGALKAQILTIHRSKFWPLVKLSGRAREMLDRLCPGRSR